MRSVFYILFGAGFTVATAWAIGTLLIRRLRLAFYKFEAGLLAFIIGSACLSEIMFVLSSVHLVRKWVLLLLGLVAIVAAVRTRSAVESAALPKLNRLPKWLFIGVFAAFTFLYFFHAMAPEMSPDGATYHLGMVAKYYRAHGFVKLTNNIYANLSEGIELLFLHAFLFGKHSAAALVHFSYLISLALLMLSYGRRIGYPVAGVAGAIFLYASPVLGMDGTVAYNDVALGAVLFALFYLLQIWSEQRDPNLLIPIGILTGFAYAVKYTAFVAVPYALGFVLWRLWSARKPFLRPVFTTAMLASLFILPWMVKNWLWLANPLSPFANRYFPNPYVHVSFEEDYRRFLGTYGLTSYRQIPYQLTVQGEALTGFFGPLFLLSPLALLSLRFRAGRQLLLAGAIFALPYATNVGTRFLIPAAPFISLALALAFANLQLLILTLALAHAVLSWPGVVTLYCGKYAWRLNGMPPFKAALRIEPEDAFLSKHFPEYNVARMLDRVVPKDGRVFSFGQVPEAYTSREVLTKYVGAFNETLGDILWDPLFSDFQARRIFQFQFPPRKLRKVQVVETARVPAQWSVAELRIFRAGSELARSPQWRLTARPNPWSVQLAFDNTPVTRWRSWRSAEPGMYIEVDFGRIQMIDRVTTESANDSEGAKLELRGMDGSGKWSTISNQPSEQDRPITVSLRLAASAELKARGVRYVLVNKDDIRSEDFRRYAALWGMQCVGESGTSRLYYIE